MTFAHVLHIFVVTLVFPIVVCENDKHGMRFIFCTGPRHVLCTWGIWPHSNNIPGPLIGPTMIPIMLCPNNEVKFGMKEGVAMH